MEYNRPVGNRKLEGRVRKFAACLRCDFAEAIARDPSAFKKRVVRFIRLALPPRRGRPPLEVVTRASNLRSQKKPWLEVYRACIEGFANLEPGNRQLATSALRSAVRARRNSRERREKSATEFLPPKFSDSNVPSCARSRLSSRVGT